MFDITEARCHVSGYQGTALAEEEAFDISLELLCEEKHMLWEAMEYNLRGPHCILPSPRCVGTGEGGWLQSLMHRKMYDKAIRYLRIGL